MKLKVKKRFRDKFTQKIYESGFYETDDRERADYLVKSGYCEEVKKPPKKKADDGK